MENKFSPLKNYPLIVLIGRKGSGKSKLARDIIRATSLAQPVVVHDPLRDWERWGPWPNNVLLFHEQKPSEVAIYNAPCTLVLDEMVLAAPTATYAAEEIITTALFARHHGIAIIAATQRPAIISASYQALVTHLAVFQTILPRDVKWVQGLKPDWRPENLRLGQFLYTEF